MEEPKSQSSKIKQLEDRLAELQQALLHKEIQADYYRELFAVMKEDGIDVEKIIQKRKK